MDCGDSLLIPAPGFGNTHLWVIVTQPDPLCIIVSLTTLRFSRDQTVVLNAGDHPFIKHAAGTAQLHKPCPPDTLRLIQDGILASPYTARKVEMFYRQRKRAR